MPAAPIAAMAAPPMSPTPTSAAALHRASARPRRPRSYARPAAAAMAMSRCTYTGYHAMLPTSSITVTPQANSAPRSARVRDPPRTATSSAATVSTDSTVAAACRTD